MIGPFESREPQLQCHIGDTRTNAKNGVDSCNEFRKFVRNLHCNESRETVVAGSLERKLMVEYWNLTRKAAKR